jgi:hypothetical protein
MASYRRSFNFRNGVQVDDDNFIVNPNGLVGIGTSVPTEFLDVRGNAFISGTLTVNSFSGTNLQNEKGTFQTLNVGITSITSGIITATTGVVTYYGDGANLLNLPTSQWIDTDVGLGFTSIYSQGNVGVATNDPRFALQIGGINNIFSFADGVGFDRKGNILTPTGFVTARSFVGYGSDLTLLSASNISSGTLNNSRLPSVINVSGSITAPTFVGNLSGIANTANSVTQTSNITVNSINSTFANVSISTVTSLLYSAQRIGIGTTNPSSDLHLRKNGSTTIQITSDGSNPSKLIFGRSVSPTGNNGLLQYGNSDLSYPSSTQFSVDLINNAVGNMNYYLHFGSPGIDTGSFNWLYGQSLVNLMSLTYNGRLGLGITNPSNTLHIVGTSTVTGDSYFGGNVYLSGSISPSTLSVVNNSIFNGRVGINTLNPVYSFQIGREPIYADGGIGISSRGDVYTAGVITATRFAGDGSSLTNLNPASITSGSLSGSYNINTTGVVTATRFAGNGSTLTNLNIENINSGTFDGAYSINSSGIITATRFSGDGSTLTSLNPSNISNGTIQGSQDINTAGVVTATRFSGDGSTLTSLNPANISNGTIQGSVSYNSSGIVTAMGGFTSDVGGPAVEISVSNGKIVFNVTGVGIAELTLIP